MKVQVILADDHVILLEGLKRLLEPFCDVLGTACDGHSLFSLAEKVRPDVIIADTSMSNPNGLEACQQLSRRLPKSKFIFLTANENAETAEEAIRRGAFGYVSKTSASAELVEAIQTVAAGGFYVSSLVRRDPVHLFVSRAKKREGRGMLTRRQREVLQLMVEGKSMKEAGNILGISSRTIAFHKYTIMEVLGITRNSELIRYAMGTLQQNAAFMAAEWKDGPGLAEWAMVEWQRRPP